MKMFYRLRFVPLILSFIFALQCFINLSGESLPYQDASPEMLEKQMIRINYWENMMIISLCAIIFSIALLIVAGVIKRRKGLR